MKIDLYTKAVLSVIAVCLIVLTLGSVDVLPSANASPMPQMSNVKTNYDGSINVKITGVESGIFSALPVEIKSNSRPIDVEVKNRYIYIKNY